MALEDLRHVEAVAIIRNLIAAMGPLDGLDDYALECLHAGEQWLRENRPSREAYMKALRDA